MWWWLSIKINFILVLRQTYYDVHPYVGSVFFPDLRDLYELLLRKEAEGSSAPMSAYYHQIERKGGRTPSLRLRFGRRADPLWHADAPADATSNWGPSLFKIIFMIKYCRLLLAFNYLFIMDMYMFVHLKTFCVLMLRGSVVLLWFAAYVWKIHLPFSIIEAFPPLRCFK